MKKTEITPKKGTRLERFMAMFGRLSFENQYYILGKTEGMLAAKDPAIGSVPAESGKKRKGNSG